MMVTLKMSERQAKIVSRACEFYARVICGQFEEIIQYTMNQQRTLSDDHYERRSRAEKLLTVAKEAVFPELQGLGHHYGVGKFEDSDIAFDIYQVLRHEVCGDDREPCIFGREPEIQCEKVKREGEKDCEK